MNVKELFSKVDIDIAIEKLCEIYPEEKRNVRGYLKVFEEIKTIPLNVKYDEKLTLFIEKDSAGGCWVYGKNGDVDEQGNVITYSLLYKPWNQILNFDIDNKVIKSQKLEVIAACILFEMTFFGFNEHDGEKRFQDLDDGDFISDESIFSVDEE